MTGAQLGLLGYVAPPVAATIAVTDDVGIAHLTEEARISDTLGVGNSHTAPATVEIIPTVGPGVVQTPSPARFAPRGDAPGPMPCGTCHKPAKVLHATIVDGAVSFRCVPCGGWEGRR